MFKPRFKIHSTKSKEQRKARRPSHRSQCAVQNIAAAQHQ
jgi:hypothetical protein